MTMTSNLDTIKDETGYGIGKLYDEKVSGGSTIPYSSAEDKILDLTSYNFHLYPEDACLMGKISKAVGVVRCAVISNLKKRKEEGIEVIVNTGSINFDDKKFKKNKNTIYVSEGTGKRGSINNLSKISKQYIHRNGLFKCIVARKNGVQYTLNFMRFFIDDGNVNCILKSLQFDRSVGKYLNKKDEDNVNCILRSLQFDRSVGKYFSKPKICYSESCQDQSRDELKHKEKNFCFKHKEKNFCIKHKEKNFCFNPDVKINDWFNVKENEIKNVTDKFINFINTVDPE